MRSDFNLLSLPHLESMACLSGFYMMHPCLQVGWCPWLLPWPVKTYFKPFRATASCRLYCMATATQAMQ